MPLINWSSNIAERVTPGKERCRVFFGETNKPWDERVLIELYMDGTVTLEVYNKEDEDMSSVEANIDFLREIVSRYDLAKKGKI